jgi:hypothetical protein
MHIDTRTHLVVETLDRRQMDGKSVEVVTEIGDYRSEGGLIFPHRLEVGPRDAPDQRQRLVVEKVEINPPLDDARFSMPLAPTGRGASGRRNPAVLP